MTKKSLWSRIKSQDFKNFILRTYDFEKLTEKDLKTLVYLHRKVFKLRVKI